MRRRVKWIGVGVLAVAGGMQLFNPARTNPPVAPGRDLCATNAPPAVVALLHAACYDCHSHETRWPWYSRVAPVSWFVVDDVNKARRHVNFSKWPHDDLHRARAKVNAMRDQISEGEMPLPTYTWMHAEARLTANDRATLIQWAEQEAKRLDSILAAEEAATTTRTNSPER